MKIVFAESLPAFRPGEMLEGNVEGEFPEPPEALELKLCWTTRAPVGVDADPVVVRTERIEKPPAQGRHPFRLELPDGPWSFEGNLFSLQWYVEVGEVRAEFILSPSGQPIRTRSDQDLAP